MAQHNQFNLRINKAVSMLSIILAFTSAIKLAAQPLSGNYNVGSAQTYTTITAAIADLISKGVSAPVTFTLTDASYASGETFPITIGAFANASAANTVTLRPATGSSSVSVNSNNSTATFDFNGVTYFTIDGRPGSSGSTGVLNIINTSASGVAIRITNDASFNTIKYCDVQGQNTVSAPSLTTAAGVIFINSANATNLQGNDNNSITDCKIHGTGTTTSSFPTIGVCAFGTQTTTNSYNDNCTVNNCNIYDIYNASLAATHIKIDLGNTAWSITNNHFYQTQNIDYLTSTAIYRILWVTPNVTNIANAANGFAINGNFFGGNNSTGTGTYTLTGSSTYQFWAMDISVGLGSATAIQNNTLTNFNITSSNTGSGAVEFINIANGNANVGTVNGNLIGSTTATPGIVYNANANTGGPIGIRTGGGTNNIITISNNIIAGFQLNSSTTVTPVFNGIAASGGTTVNVTNNTIGSATIANSINATSATTSTSIQSIRGIILNGTGVTGTVSGNLISNMNSNSIATGSQASTVVGIIVASTAGAYTISGNTIRNLTSSGQTTSNASTPAMIGIAYVTATGPAVITNNIIHSLKLTNTSTTAATNITGIYYSGPSGTNYIDKNFLHSFSNASSTSSGYMRGIDILSGATNIINNMIRLGTDENGSALTPSLNIAGIYETGGTNNVFFNSICINGSNVGTGSYNTSAFLSGLSNVSREIKNNIFYNVRSNGTSTGKHYAIQLLGVTNQSILANNYWNGSGFLSQLGGNDYTSFGAWKAATGQDSLSFSVNPLFKSDSSNATNVNLHIDTTGTAISFLESGGIGITNINIDIDNESRPGPTGSTKGGGLRVDIGADEFDGVPRPQCLNSVAGNTESSTDTVCYGGSVLLTLSGSSGIGIGNSYQWQTSTDGINFTNITNYTLNWTVVNLNATAYFRCMVKCIFGNTTSNSTPKKVVVNNPSITSTTSAQMCGAGSMVLGATASIGKISWYANASGGTALDTGITFTTPFLTITTTYYVEAVYRGCASGTRTPVTATVKTIPTITGVISNSLCGPGSMVLSASTGAGTIDWYTSATGGSSIFTGLSFTTPSLSVTTTYFVAVTANGCVSVARTPVTATILPLPFITSTTPAGTCGSGSVVLHAASNTGIIYWYSASSGGTLLDTGTVFTTPTIFSPTTYYLEVRSNPCITATRTSILASVYSNPTINGTTSASGCSGDIITLGAAASAGTINWYTTPAGGSSIATGTSFITPPLYTTTTYYVDATNNGCTSSFRTPAKATINLLPTINSVTSASVCGSGNMTLGAAASGGLIGWYSDSTGGVPVGNGPSYTTPILTITDTFYVETKDNGCTSYPRILVIAKVKKIPTITATSSALSCKPASLILTATPSSGSVSWYNVSFGGTAIFTGNSFTTPLLSSSNTYYVEAIDSGCVTSARTSLTATIYPALNKATTINGFTITATAVGVNYQWLNCNNGFQPIAGATNQSFTPSQNGLYAVQLKDNFCTDTSACITVSKIGIIKHHQNRDVFIAPNPTSNFVFFKSNTALIGTHYHISDVLGREITQGVITSENQKVSLESFNPGLYFLCVGDIVSESYRIIKK